MDHAPTHPEDGHAHRDPPRDHPLIVAVPDDAAEQLADLLRDAAWLVPRGGDRPGEAALADLAGGVLRLLGDWQTRGRHRVSGRDRGADQPVPVIDAGRATIDRAVLLAGESVRRDCESGGGGRLRTTVPCCGRTVLLARDTDDGTEHVACCGCRLAYTVVLNDEGDDGWGNHSYAAFFTASTTIIVAAHRPSPR